MTEQKLREHMGIDPQKFAVDVSAVSWGAPLVRVRDLREGGSIAISVDDRDVGRAAQRCIALLNKQRRRELARRRREQKKHER